MSRIRSTHVSHVSPVSGYRARDFDPLSMWGRRTTYREIQARGWLGDRTFRALTKTVKDQRVRVGTQEVSVYDLITQPPEAQSEALANVWPRYIGTRAGYMPFARKLLENFPEQGHILDLVAGSGELGCELLMDKGPSHHARLTLNDPAEDLLARCLNEPKYAHLRGPRIGVSVFQWEHLREFRPTHGRARMELCVGSEFCHLMTAEDDKTRSGQKLDDQRRSLETFRMLLEDDLPDYPSRLEIDHRVFEGLLDSNSDLGGVDHLYGGTDLVASRIVFRSWEAMLVELRDRQDPNLRPAYLFQRPIRYGDLPRMANGVGLVTRREFHDEVEVRPGTRPKPGAKLVHFEFVKG